MGILCNLILKIRNYLSYSVFELLNIAVNLSSPRTRHYASFRYWIARVMTDQQKLKDYKTLDIINTVSFVSGADFC